MQKFVVKNKQGQRIVGVVDGLEAGKKKPAVILLAGFKGCKDQPHIKYPACEMAKKGFVTVRFDMTDKAMGIFLIVIPVAIWRIWRLFSIMFVS